MYLNIVVSETESWLTEYEWSSIKEFRTAYEDFYLNNNPQPIPNSASFPIIMPNPEAILDTVDYDDGKESHSWNREDLDDYGIWKVKDLYQWILQQENNYLN